MTEENTERGAERLDLTDEQWRSRLSAAEYKVLRQKATDVPFTGEFTHPGRRGVFRCAGCGAELFLSDTQFDSGSGWPSFTAPVSSGAVDAHDERSYGMVRTEIACSRCGGHLGHVFPDGPGPTGERYCINSTALSLEPEDTTTAKSE
jgi:peptide-methionine (R)-S-oxide reductase